MATIAEKGNSFFATVNGVYCNASEESLLPHHVIELAKSGITPRIAKENGIHSVTDLRRMQAILNRKHGTNKFGAAIVFPVRDIAGRLRYERLRPDNPRKNSATGKPIKYESPTGCQNEPFLGAKTRAALQGGGVEELVFTEGERKSVAIEQYGIPTVGLVGVHGWKQKYQQTLSPAIREIVTKLSSKAVVYIVFDSDVETKEQVLSAERWLAHHLQSYGLTVRIVRLPHSESGEKQGADDFLVSSGMAALRQRMDDATAPEPPDAAQVKSPLKDMAPESIAKAFVRECEDDSGFPRLVFWSGRFYLHSHGRFRVQEIDDVKRLLIGFLESRYTGIETRYVSNILMNVQAFCGIRSDQIPPFGRSSQFSAWRQRDTLCTRSHVLNLPLLGTDAAIVPASAAYFSLAAVGVDYNPVAEPPHQWLECLDDWFDGDQESQLLLQQYFGYCLTPDTRQQKILFIKGRRRSGKGTLLRILRALVGDCASPSIATLCDTFGLESLVGKPVAIIADARIPKKHDVTIAMERILNITGEDPVTVNRKNKKELQNVSLPVKFVIATNDFMAIDDPSGALSGRMACVEMAKSYYNAEDMELTERLKAELPGILLWAIEGWRSLRESGRLVTPTASAKLSTAVETRMSPIRGFVGKKCELSSLEKVRTDDLYRAYRDWLEEEGLTDLKISSKETFVKSLLESFPELASKRFVIAKQKIGHILGINLRPEFR